MKLKIIILFILISINSLTQSAETFSFLGEKYVEGLVVAAIGLLVTYKFKQTLDEEIKQIIEEETLKKQKQIEAKTDLLDAAQKGDFEKVSEIIKMPNVDLNFQDKNGNTALLIAIKEVNDVINQARNLNIEIPDDVKVKMISYLYIIELLIENGADFATIRNLEEFTPKMLLIVLVENLHDFIVNQKYIEQPYKEQSQLNELDKQIFEKLEKFEKYNTMRKQIIKDAIFKVLYSLFG